MLVITVRRVIVPTYLFLGAKQPPVISDSGAMITNVTGLTIGSYTFQLEVKDNSGNTATDQTQITVKQDTNQAPVSNPGPNMKIVLPTDQVVLDGSGSSDDLAIESWLWIRDPESLAGGNIVGNLSSSHLVITNLVPGSYSFTLKVIKYFLFLSQMWNFCRYYSMLLFSPGF